MDFQRTRGIKRFYQSNLVEIKRIKIKHLETTCEIRYFFKNWSILL